MAVKKRKCSRSNRRERGDSRLCTSNNTTYLSSTVDGRRQALRRRMNDGLKERERGDQWPSNIHNDTGRFGTTSSSFIPRSGNSKFVFILGMKKIDMMN
jgi:hypothetical protein